MNKKQYLLLLSGLMVGSYAYIFDMMVNPAMMLSFFGLLISMFMDIDKLFDYKNILMNIIMILTMVIIFNILKMEVLFNGITFVSTMNIVVINQYFCLYGKLDSYLENVIYKVSIIYLIIILLIMILPSSFILYGRFVVFVAISSLFLPFFINCIIIYVNYYYKYYYVNEVRYDTISNN